MDHRITVIGIGPGSPDYLTPIAARAIARATVLVGGRRALAAFAPPGAETHTIGRDIAAALDYIGRRLADNDVAVLVSGDPGFHSLLPSLSRAFGPGRIDVIPGVSSLQLAFARLAVPWQDAVLVSLHGRDGDQAALAYAPGKKLALLTDAANSPRAIAAGLIARGWPPATAVWLCADLSYPHERIEATDLAAAAGGQGVEHCVMVVIA
jgi:cobalt-precorrin-7 (C5)-methyltransferase